MLQSEELAMAENLETIPQSLAMFASNLRPNGNNSQNQGSRRGRGRNNSNRGRGGGRFNNNNGGASHQNFSPQQQSNSQFGNLSYRTDSTRPMCQICGKSGHLALDCYHRMDFAYQGKNPPTKLVAMTNVSNAAITSNRDPWLTNSGTLDHSQPI